MSKLIDMIPASDLEEALNEKCCELDYDFLCFEKPYQAVAKYVPKHYDIIDLGCYMAAQAYLFQDFHRYIGVDCYDVYQPTEDDFYIPPRRFRTQNCTHVRMSIQEYISSGAAQKHTEKAGWKVYAICSAVPDSSARHLVYETFDNCLLWYPGQKPLVKGVGYRKIANAMKGYW